MIHRTVLRKLRLLFYNIVLRHTSSQLLSWPVCCLLGLHSAVFSLMPRLIRSHLKALCCTEGNKLKGVEFKPEPFPNYLAISYFVKHCELPDLSVIFCPCVKNTRNSIIIIRGSRTFFFLLQQIRGVVEMWPSKRTALAHHHAHLANRRGGKKPVTFHWGNLWPETVKILGKGARRRAVQRLEDEKGGG